MHRPPEMSSSFKRLQSERNALAKVFREQTPLQGLEDMEALQSYLVGVGATASVRLYHLKLHEYRLLILFFVPESFRGDQTVDGQAKVCVAFPSTYSNLILDPKNSSQCKRDE